jgi:hypothetical protein
MRYTGYAAAIAAALIAVAALRGPIAGSHAVRGDTPVSVVSADGTAVDRFAFKALIKRDHATMHAALQVCSTFLRRNPNDWAVRFDRALLFDAVGNTRRAQADLAMVGLWREHSARTHWRTAAPIRRRSWQRGTC